MEKPGGSADPERGFFAKVGASLFLMLVLTPLVASPALARGKDEPPTRGSTVGRGQATFPVTVMEDGSVSAGYDVFVPCDGVSTEVDDEYVRAEYEATLHAIEEGGGESSEAPTEGEIRARVAEQSARQVEACREAGFPTADERTAEAGTVPTPQGTLPGTGGASTTSLLSVAGLVLVGLVARCRKARRVGRPGPPRRA